MKENYLLVSHRLTRWAVTVCPTNGDCRAAIKHSHVGHFTLSTWFSHTSMTCRPRSSLLWVVSSCFRVGASNPSLSPSFQYLLAVRSDSCSRTSSRSSLAIKDNIIHELMIFIMLVYQHVSLTQFLLGYLIYTSFILTYSWFFIMCCSHAWIQWIEKELHNMNTSKTQNTHKIHALKQKPMQVNILGWKVIETEVTIK